MHVKCEMCFEYRANCQCNLKQETRTREAVTASFIVF